MSGSNPVWQYFHEHKLDLVLDANRDKGLITLNTDQTLEDAVRLFSKHGITSAPVVDSKTSQVNGVLDLTDISYYFLTLFPSQKTANQYDDALVQTIARTLHLRTVSEVMNSSSRNLLVVLSVHQPLTVAAEHLAQGAHRAPVVDDKNAVIGLVTQSKLLQLVAAHPHKSKEMFAATLQSLSLGLPTSVVCVKRTATVLEALKQMVEGGVTAVAVVDSNGKLSGTFSSSDVTGLFSSSIPSFNETVEDYLLKNSPSSLSSICVRPSSSLEATMKLLVDAKIHRAWVIDNDFKPTGVVAMTDLFQLFKTHRA